MDIGFFFEFEGEVVQLPINPPQIDVSSKGNNKLVEIVKLGEINILRDRKLTDISFSSWLPYEPWFPGIRTTGRFKDPEFYKDLFEKIRESSKPARFIVTGLNINMLVSIEEFTYYHQAGDHEDAYYTLKLKEYREYSLGKEGMNIETSTKEVEVVKVDNKPKREPTQVTIGSNVKLNGRVHLDSYGSKPGKSFSNYSVRVNLINPKGSHPYHVTTMDGGHLGWVTADSVVLL